MDSKVILWTCRVDDRLEAAVRWCAEQGLVFDAVNDNLPELVAKYGSNCRKVCADRYIDDRAILTALLFGAAVIAGAGIVAAFWNDLVAFLKKAVEKVRAAQATGADLVISHFFRVDGERQAQRGHIKGERLLTRQEFAQEMVKAPANYYYGALWNKLYRRSIVARQGLRFPADVSWSEDFLFNLEYIRHVRLVAAVPKPLYYYHKRRGSLITSQATLRRLIRIKRDTFNYYKDLYQDLDLYDEQKAKVYRYLIAAATDGTTLTLPGRGERDRRHSGEGDR